jgi:hypothetical protein
MTIKKLTQILIKGLALTLILCTSLQAQVTESEVRRLEKRIIKMQRQIAKKFSRLTPQARAAVMLARSGKSTDSDGDNVPDNFEETTGRCDSDSDDDGIDDGDEFEDGTDPSDDDSDDDGHSDGDELEVHSEIQAITSNNLTLAGQTFILNGSTEYLDDDNNSIASSTFKVGDCVEVEGHLSGSDKIADKVKQDDDC